MNAPSSCMPEDGFVLPSPYTGTTQNTQRGSGNVDRLKRIPHLDFLPIAILVIVAYMAIINVNIVLGMLGTALSILTPVIWGVVISFVLSPIVDIMMKRLRVRKVPAIIISYVLFTGAIVAIFTILVPIMSKNVNDLIGQLPTYMAKLESLLARYGASIQSITKLDYASMFNFDLSNISMAGIKDFISSSGQYFNIFTGVITGVFNVTSAILKIFIGFIISIYMILDRDLFARGAKRAAYAFLDREKAEGLISLVNEAGDLFSRYLIGQATDAFIIGVIAVIGFSILGVPYAALMGIIIGITNMIPFLGPIIGGIPVVGIALFTSPLSALYALVFILVLQQVDGNIISPRVVGGSVGVNPFWSILAILVGGSLFGIVGMIMCIPTFALIRNVFVRSVEKRIREKNISVV
jgi:predicted PurR-regulated permease PerM